MTLLILGLLLWYAGHFFKRALPGLRAGMGDKGKGVAALLILAGVLAMVLGYRATVTSDLWFPPSFMVHVNNLLVLIAFYLFAASGAKTAITRKIRHPQLTGFIAWAVAHLLVNGDLASVVLFGGLLIWAVAEIAVINRAEPDWTQAGPVPVRKEVTTAIAAVVVFVVVAAIHGWIGPSPFPG